MAGQRLAQELSERDEEAARWLRDRGWTVVPPEPGRRSELDTIPDDARDALLAVLSTPAARRNGLTVAMVIQRLRSYPEVSHRYHGVLPELLELLVRRGEVEKPRHRYRLHP